MKLSILLVFVMQLFEHIDTSRLSTSKAKSGAPQAIARILIDYLATNSHTVDVISYGIKSGSSEALVDLKLRRTTGSTVIRVLKGENPSKFILNTTSILAFDSLRNFERIASKIIWQSNPHTHRKHLVSIANLAIEDLYSLQLEKDFSFECVKFLTAEKSIDLVENVMFSPRICHQRRWNIINHFDTTTRLWNHSDYYPNTNRDLFGCPLVVAVTTRGLSRVARNTIEILSTVRNFTVLRKYYVFTPANHVPFRFDFIEQFIEDGVTAVPSVRLDFTVIHHAIPPGEPYSQFEKMFMMFDFEVWLAIIFTLLSALGAIQIVNLMPQSVKNVLYGSHITTPTLNLASTFLTGGQNRMPRNDFARFLLILFIIWSLIIRTCHQSMLFQYLQADLRKPRVASVKELSEKGFTFYSQRMFTDYE